jgi:SRSO17 transposase
MDTDRNYANIARRVIAPTDDGQNLQQFMSDSPWSGEKVFQQIQSEIQLRPELQGEMLTLDESGDERAGGESAGAARQYLGRLGKVEMGQVGVALSYYAADIWTMVDAELYLPESWFEKDLAPLRRQLHIPETGKFLTKQAGGVIISYQEN